MSKVIEGTLVVPAGARFCVVASRFNHLVVDLLVQGALDALARHGGKPEDVTIVRVPGAWELPFVVQRLCASAAGSASGSKSKSKSKTAKLDAIIALGAVIRGATPHFDYVAGQAASGIASASNGSGVPVAFGVLTTDTIEQAMERAGSKAGNKGWDAACTAIEMVSLARALDGAGF